MKYIIFAILILIYSCNVQEKEESDIKDNEQVQTETKTLTEALEERAAASAKRSGKKSKKLNEKAFQKIRESGILEKATQEGDEAPDFQLPNAVGEQVKLSDQLKKGPVILMWYRGGWCPYCNLTLKYMNDRLDEFKQYNANLIAISPELPDKSLSTKEKRNLEFEVVSDKNNKTAKKYGIVYDLHPDLAKKYEGAFGLSDYYGNEDHQLPLSATYLINKDGKVVYSFLDVDYKKRAAPDKLLEVLKKMEQGSF